MHIAGTSLNVALVSLSQAFSHCCYLSDHSGLLLPFCFFWVPAIFCPKPSRRVSLSDLSPLLLHPDGISTAAALQHAGAAASVFVLAWLRTWQK